MKFEFTSSYCVLLLFFLTNNLPAQNANHKVKIEVLFEDMINIRAITIDKNVVWYAANGNRFGKFDLKTKIRTEKKIGADSLKIEFRSSAQTKNDFFIVNVGSPARLYKISKKEMMATLVYTDYDKDVFYDAMQFYDDKNGIAVGDPLTDGFTVITTTDGGKTWQKMAASKLPKNLMGEAAFAASNTTLVIKNGKTWMLTGGKKSRAFYSENKGQDWQVYAAPLVQGEAMTGIFTADFYNQKTGVIAGGNYEKPNQNFGNKAITINGGKTWNLIAENDAFGYTSCIQFVPKSGGNKIMSVGASGLYYSANQGKTWVQLSADANLYTIRFIDAKTAVAAGKNKMIKISFN